VGGGGGNRGKSSYHYKGIAHKVPQIKYRARCTCKGEGHRDSKNTGSSNRILGGKKCNYVERTGQRKEG